MQYSTALSVAAKAATYLQDDEGSMSEEEAINMIEEIAVNEYGND
jgi:hypothetical protein